jgi:hydroxymethylpyrimidine/phosphomethylpyrimidine kinase
VYSIGRTYRLPRYRPEVISPAPAPPVALTIAGSDSGGAAGIQADLKTFAMHRVFGTSVVTTLTAQNSAQLRAVVPVDPPFVQAQLDAVLDDLPVAAAKTGMLGSAEIVALVAASASRLPLLVVDPVLVDSSGRRLFGTETERAYVDLLFPLATVVTPNRREAGVLTGRELSTVDDAVAAAEELAKRGARAVVVKSAGAAIDVVYSGGTVELLRAPLVDTANTHGSGCTFAAATAARLARGDDLATALRGAKVYVHDALATSAGWRLGAGHGPLSWTVT